jgi:hypothetical protein
MQLPFWELAQLDILWGHKGFYLRHSKAAAHKMSDGSHIALNCSSEFFIDSKYQSLRSRLLEEFRQGRSEL